MNIEQLTFESQPELVHTVRRGTPQEQWDAAVAANPWLVGEVVRTLRQLVDAGKRPSLNRAFEEMRERVHTTGSEYRMNNTWRAPAARHVIRLHPEFATVIETRRSRP
jgi:hypothetical protein